MNLVNSIINTLTNGVVVLTADSYQNRKPIHPQGGPGRNVHLLTERPMSRDDVTRPPTKPNN